MLLVEALQRAGKFVDKGKEALPILKSLRFIPAYNGMPARLYATNGVVGILVDVDQPLPNMVLPAEPLIKLCRDTTAVIGVENQGNAQALVTVTGKAAKGAALYTLQGLPPSEFPGFPAIPERFHRIQDYQWWSLQRVVHAAGKNKAEAELMNISFRPTAIEATDRSRVARAEVSGPWSGLVPSQLFQHWPKSGDVFCVFTEYYCFWRVGQELRFAIIQRSEKYPNLEKIIPEVHDGWWMVMNVRPLMETVKRAFSMSPTASVVLDFGLMGLTVRAHSKKGTEFTSQLSGKLGVPSGRTAQFTEILLDGKLLWEALRAFDTPKVRLCFGEAREPLRLESGNVVECLWPMLASQPEGIE